MAASGVCHVLQEFWSALPTATTKQALSYIVGTLGQDASCANVRVAVMTGLHSLLEQPLAHSVLKQLLPALVKAVHDTSERVRVAFLTILCKVKDIRNMVFYNIVPVDQLLLRFEDDAVHRRAAGCLKMTELLLNSFFPPSITVNNNTDIEEEEDEMIIRLDKERCRRCLEFVKSSPVAAVAFYTHLHTQIDLLQLTRFTMTLFQLFCILDLDEQQQEEEEQQSSHTTTTGHKTKRDHHRSSTTTATATTPAVISLSQLLLQESPAVYVELLNIVHILLCSVWKTIKQSSHKDKDPSVNHILLSSDHMEIASAVLLIFSRSQIGHTLHNIQTLGKQSADTSANNTSKVNTKAMKMIRKEAMRTALLLEYMPHINCWYLKIFTLVHTLYKPSYRNSCRRETNNNNNNNKGDEEEDQGPESELLTSKQFITEFDQFIKQNHSKTDADDASDKVHQLLESQARSVVETVTAMGDKHMLYESLVHTMSYYQHSSFVDNLHVITSNNTDAAAVAVAVTGDKNKKNKDVATSTAAAVGKKRKNTQHALHPSSSTTTTTPAQLLSLETAIELLSATCLTVLPTCPTNTTAAVNSHQDSSHDAAVNVSNIVSLYHYYLYYEYNCLSTNNMN